MALVCLITPPGIKTTSGLQMHTPNPPLGLTHKRLKREHLLASIRSAVKRDLSPSCIFVIGFRTVRSVAKALIGGREETRYAKWFRDVFKTCRRWHKAASRPQQPGFEHDTSGREKVSPVSVPDVEVLIELPVLNQEPQEVSVG